MRNAGATQNETTSARESNSRPNWLVAFIRRATRPSRMSMIIATKIASAASVYRFSTVRRSAKNPQKRFPVVRRLGSRKIPSRRRSRSSCQRRRLDPLPCRRITVAGSARPEDSVGGLSQARPGYVPLSPSRPGAPSRQESEDGDATRYAVADAHAHIGPSRHHAVGARAEADHAEPLARGELVSRADPADDPPGDHPRDLDDR